VNKYVDLKLIKNAYQLQNFIPADAGAIWILEMQEYH